MDINGTPLVEKSRPPSSTMAPHLQISGYATGLPSPVVSSLNRPVEAKERTVFYASNAMISKREVVALSVRLHGEPVGTN